MPGAKPHSVCGRSSTKSQLFAALEGGEPVDLVEIIVGAGVARIALARRRPVGPEMRPVVFRAGDQHHAAQAQRGPLDRRDGVDQHGAVRRDVFGIARGGAGRGLKRRVENVRGVAQAGELVRRLLSVEQIHGDVAIARRGLGGAARQADDGPVALLEQPRDDVAPDHAERADDDGLFVLCHAWAIRPFPQASACRLSQKSC